MAVTQYVGARYVPLFADPLEWDSNKSYEPLTIVYHTGNSYTSRQFVPSGIEINNETYWALTGNYNAQIDQYREEVKQYDTRIAGNANAIAAEVARATAAEATKAPTNHASEETIYGVGNAVNYGHLKLADNDTPMKSGANDGVAATPDYVKKSIDDAPYDIVALGDSFGDGITGSGKPRSEYGWLKYIKTNKPNYVRNVYNNTSEIIEGNTGFASTRKFLDVLKSMVNNDITDIDSVRRIIVLGGTNDNSFNATTIESNIQEFMNYVKTKFKNTRVTIGYLGTNSRDVAFPAYQNAVKYGADFIDMSTVFGFKSYITDGTHYNDDGYKVFAPVIHSKLFSNGEFTIRMNISELTKDDGITLIEGGFQEWCTTNQYILLPRNPYNVTPLKIKFTKNLSYGTPINVTKDDSFMPCGLRDFFVTCDISDSTGIVGKGLLSYNESKKILELIPYVTKESKSYTVTAPYTSFVKPMPY